MENQKKRSRAKFFLVASLIFIVICVAVLFGAQFITKTGIFRVPGVAYFDTSLNDNEIIILKRIFTEDVDLDKNVTIRADEVTALPDLESNQYLFAINVPVTDFYDVRTDTTEFAKDEYTTISLGQLDFKKKLLAMEGKYYLDDFNDGAIFRIITFDSEKFEEEIKPLVDADFSKTWPNDSSVLTMAQTGVTALSRGMNAKLTAVGGDPKYFSKNIGGFLRDFDITHTSNESSFTSFATSENICSDTRFLNTLLDIGLDVVELTGNHNQDCGNQAAYDSIKMYEENGIKIVGGGKNATAAAVPLELNEKDTSITFLAYNQSTGGATLGDTPGANQYNEANAAAEITEAKKRGDFIIVDIQYYECSAYASEYEDTTCDYANSAAGDQVGFFRHLINLGADIVVGTSAHQPQTYELYEDGAIYYGLGNLFFDQAWWPGTTRSLILAHYFYDGKLLQTKIVPTVYDSSLQTKLLDGELSKWFLGRLISERP